MARLQGELDLIGIDTLFQALSSRGVEGILEVKEAVESDAVADYRDARYDNHKTLAMAGTAGLLDRLAPAAAVQLA